MICTANYGVKSAPVPLITLALITLVPEEAVAAVLKFVQALAERSLRGDLLQSQGPPKRLVLAKRFDGREVGLAQAQQANQLDPRYKSRIERLSKRSVRKGRRTRKHPLPRTRTDRQSEQSLAAANVASP